MSDVARRALVTQGTLTVAINRLVKKGYVARYKDEVDKRIVRLSLTQRALDVLKVHDAFHEKMIDTFIHDLKVDEDTNLILSLEKIMDYFKQNY
jgi:DNA-binding MarR family transcriptional regulator